jgi:acyl-ACP thioesterase
MASHARIFQYAPIGNGDYLTYRTFPRVIEGNRYIYYVEIYRGDELVVRFDASYIPVDKKERHVLRIAQVEPLWKTPSRAAVSRNLRRLRPDCAFTPCGSDTVRCSDCDFNGHMTSGAYMALVCDALGLWESEKPRYIRMIQLDFSSEVRPGTLLEFSRGEEFGLLYLRGTKPDGTVAFTAACVY